MKLNKRTTALLNGALNREGLRSTKQREHVFSVLLGQSDHPTAVEIHARAKLGMPSISLATVYNCLETLVDCSLVRQVNFERESSRFCPNLAEHAHFYDDSHDRIYDIDLPNNFLAEMKMVLPEGFEASQVNLSFRGKKSKG
ncbi:MAG: Peroxide-responsive repressor PerR [Candidatus Moanabacter tarae]|uniref:Peroxide-responsive repressor PerR n=1 Tax=Candidatus Moanibacter tarae TaxID=2200854 RepID=A0A2Z4AB25_9BACT|nr:MAG: Peroxide-responsive repressor PerR [Candidatus Moanabacter tarae]|tara:strand:- start:2725 stop:3150 length:426 start_codon:yes stop_codon:yes gene_type:complete